MSVFNYKVKKLNVLIAAKWGFCQKNNVLLYKVAAFQTGTDCWTKSAINSMEKIFYKNWPLHMERFVAVTYRCNVLLQLVA